MYTRVVEKDPRWLYYVPDHFKTQKMCHDVVCSDPYSLPFIPDNLKMQGMCEKVLKDNPEALEQNILKRKRCVKKFRDWSLEPKTCLRKS